MAERDVANLQKDMGQLENVRRRLVEFFCEDINSFKLEECFRIFHGFYCKFKQAVAENARRRLQEEQANARRRQREELLATKRRQSKMLLVPIFKILKCVYFSGKFCRNTRFRMQLSGYANLWSKEFFQQKSKHFNQ